MFKSLLVVPCVSLSIWLCGTQATSQAGTHGASAVSSLPSLLLLLHAGERHEQAADVQGGQGMACPGRVPHATTALGLPRGELVGFFWL